MNKSFNLNNEMRQIAATGMTVKAVQKAANQVVAQLGRINAEFWKQHKAIVHEDLGRAPQAWPGLIQRGLLTSTTEVTPSIEKKNDEGEIEWAVPISIEIGSAAKQVLSSPKIELTGEHRFLRIHHYSRRHFAIRLKHNCAVPRVNDMERVADRRLAARLRDAADKVSSLVSATNEFYHDALTVLESCRTSKQVADIFPEALQYLPEPPAKVSHLVAQDKANAVRDRLASGVPPAAR